MDTPWERGSAGCLDRPPEASAEATSSQSPTDATILVVDDDPEIRDVVRWLLEDEGWRVETASDGRHALEQVARVHPALIVLDMGLPILNGEEVAQRLHQVYDDPPPIIVVSADGRAGEKAGRIAAAAYLHKPFDVDALARLVRRTLGSP